MKLSKLTKSLNMVKSHGYKLHHYASERGYCAAGMVGDRRRYSGRFGKGWVIVTGKLHGSNNYTEIAYYTK